MKNIVITHGYSDSNKGDLAIVLGTVNGIKEVAPDSKIKLQSVYSEEDPDFSFHSRFIRQAGVEVEEGIIPSPYIDDKQHSNLRNLTAMLRLFKDALSFHLLNIFPNLFKGHFPRQYKAIQSIKKADIVIAKGGQYIYNDQGGLRGFLYLWRILKPISYAIKVRKKVAILGKSIGPFQGKYALFAFKNAVKGIDLLVVREKKSEALLHSTGIKENVILAPDMAFLINPEIPVNYSDRFGYLEKNNWVGITVVNWYYPNSSNPRKAKQAYIEAIIQTAKKINDELNMKIVFFPQVTVKHHGESDLDLIEHISNELEKLKINVQIVKDDISPMELSYLYGKCKVLLGTRLHSCILAACSATPVIAIRYQGFKTEGVMAELGLSRYVHDINKVNADEIFSDIKEVLNDRESLVKIIKSNVNNHKKFIRKVLKEFFGKGI